MAGQLSADFDRRPAAALGPVERVVRRREHAADSSSDDSGESAIPMLRVQAPNSGLVFSISRRLACTWATKTLASAGLVICRITRNSSPPRRTDYIQRAASLPQHLADLDQQPVASG